MQVRSDAEVEQYNTDKAVKHSTVYDANSLLNRDPKIAPVHYWRLNIASFPRIAVSAAVAPIIMSAGGFAPFRIDA